MIIVCPSCTTRYDIKAVLPPEGRAVRCAKCGAVWRALPENMAEEAPEDAPAAATPSAQAVSEHAQAARSEIPSGPTTATSLHFADAGEAQDDQLNANGADAASDGDDDGLDEEHSSMAEPSEALTQPVVEPVERQDFAAAGKARKKSISWFRSFRRGPRTEESLSPARPPERSFSSTEPRLPDGPAHPIPAADEDVLEEARQAIRRVFFDLGEGPAAAFAGASPGATPPAPEPSLSGKDLDAASDTVEEAYYKRGVWQAEPQETGAAEAEMPTVSDERDVAEDAYRSEPDSSAVLDDFSDLDDGRRSAPDLGSEEPTIRDEQEALSLDSLRSAEEPELLRDGDIAQQLEQQLLGKSVASAAYIERVRLDAFPLGWRDQQDLEGAVAEADEPPSGGAEEATFDSELFHEIEKAQEHPGEAPRSRRGGLALAAAWGLFVCVVSGLGFIALSYRDVVAEALPGTAALYRALGMPVTAQPLIFESVQYSWTVVDGKAALVVTGSVFNRAGREVQVPDFFVTVKDADPSLDREYPVTLDADGDRIEADDSADFEIELLSPSPTVTAVELELRNVR